MYYFLALSWVTWELLGVLVTATENPAVPHLISTLPCLFGFWGVALGAEAMTKKGKLRGRQGYWAGGALQLRFRTQFHLLCPLFVGFINWKMESFETWWAIWEAACLWTSACDKKGLGKMNYTTHWFPHSLKIKKKSRNLFLIYPGEAKMGSVMSLPYLNLFSISQLPWYKGTLWSSPPLQPGSPVAHLPVSCAPVSPCPSSEHHTFSCFPACPISVFFALNLFFSFIFTLLLFKIFL